MATVVLVRHGRTTANSSGVLAGRSPGVRLDERGREQAARAGERLSGVPLVALVSSPLTRCQETARAIVAGQSAVLRIRTERGITECDYGSWQGRPLKELARDRLWRTVQAQPSAAVFPDGESLADMQARSVATVRRLDAEVDAEHGPSAVWALVSHGDIIKSLLADALGLHLDLFQRLHVDPASLSVVRYAADRPTVLGVNTHEGELSWLAGRRAARRGAEVGGGAGPDHSGTRPARSAPARRTGRG